MCVHVASAELKRGCLVLTAPLTGVASVEGKFMDAEDGMFDLSDRLLHTSCKCLAPRLEPGFQAPPVPMAGQ